MSSKITIAPAEIMAVLGDTPPAPQPAAGGTVLDAAMQAMDAREKSAAQTRVVFYRYDDGQGGDGQSGGAAADAHQAAIAAGALPLHAVAQMLNCDLQLIELGRGPYGAEDAARAAAFGMMAAEQDTGLLVVAAFGAGSAARAAQTDPARFFDEASPEIAAVMGAMIGAARAGIPLIAEGPQGVAAARAIKAARPDLCARIFICGVTGTVDGIPVFTDEGGRPEPGDAAVTLAALFHDTYGKRQKAA